MTALDLITNSLADLGVNGAGQAVSSDQSALGLSALNILLDDLGAQRLFCYSIQRTVYPYTVNQFIYEIGPTAADFIQDRPILIQKWGMILASSGGLGAGAPLISVNGQLVGDASAITVNGRLAGGGAIYVNGNLVGRAGVVATAQPALEIPHARCASADEYAAITMKALASTFPTVLYYDYASPNARLIFWPAPQQAGNQFALYYPQELKQVSSVSDVINLPPGYAHALEYLLAMELAPKYGRDPSDTIVYQARRSTMFLKARNSYTPDLLQPFDRGAGYYNWLTDQIQ